MSLSDDGWLNDPRIQLIHIKIFHLIENFCYVNYNIDIWNQNNTENLIDGADGFKSVYHGDGFVGERDIFYMAEC